MAYRLSGNHEDAQDLVQEVLLRVQRGLATYQPGSIEGWLSRIATNAFLDDVRRRKRRPSICPTTPRWDRVAPSTVAADEQLAIDQLPAHVQEAVRDLPDDYRAAVVLCDVVGPPYDEISAALDVPWARCAPASTGAGPACATR